MKFEGKYFRKFPFSEEQIKRYCKNAFHDLEIANKDSILDVKFNYTYTALIKASIALLSAYQIKIRSVPGHHIKLIEKVSQILADESVSDIANVMRSKRNLGLYAGGMEITEKECREYLKFTEKIIKKIDSAIKKLNIS
jgi:uncharacterized protein (UPF0332 family)